MLHHHLLDLHSLRRNLSQPLKELQRMQNKKLRAIIRHAYENVPFYHRKLDDSQIKPEDIRSAEDLSKMPMTTKSEIQSCNPPDIVAGNIDTNQCVKRYTSGSTGRPLTIIIDKRTEDLRFALWARTLRESGLRLRDRMAIIKDPLNFPKKTSIVRRLGIIKRKCISVFDDAETQLALLEDYKPDVIKGYPSSLAILANIIGKTKSRVKPRLLFTGAELLDNATRKTINSAFGCELLDHYGCIEFSLLMWECHEHAGYHMNIDTAVIEFIKKEEAVTNGECGEIVCTSLANYAMPLIRFRLGDEGIPVEDSCICGRSLPITRILAGRKDDFLVTLDGRLISPLVFSPYPFEALEGIKQFRIIQEARDRIRLQLVLKANIQDIDCRLQKAETRIQQLFGRDMQVEFQILQRLRRGQRGKFRKVISRIS